jgi:hypothetical protein
LSCWLVGDLESDGIFFDGNVVGVDDVQLGEKEQVMMREWHFVSSESVRRYIYINTLDLLGSRSIETTFWWRSQFTD